MPLIRRGPLIHRLTKASKQVLEEEIKKAMDEQGITEQAEALRKDQEEIKKLLEDEKTSEGEKRALEKRFAEQDEKLAELDAAARKLADEKKQSQLDDAKSPDGGKSTEEVAKKDEGGSSGGCYPGSAIFYDSNFRARRIESLQVGDEVLVITKNGIQSDPVITFIHRQPEVVEGFLKIVTTKEKILLITADHLLFVELTGQATAIPARDVKVGDTVYVRGSHGSEKDLVRSISTVYEKGAYAPVTLSGTILVNDVHTSCYFDVLSHEWSHRAMSIARALHYVSPSMERRISAVGEKDGFPGWCRLAHTMLTLLD